MRNYAIVSAMLLYIVTTGCEKSATQTSLQVTTESQASIGQPLGVTLMTSAWFEADGGIDAVCVSPDGLRLYVAYWGNGKGQSPVEEYDTTTGRRLSVFKFDDSHNHGGLAMSPDGWYLYTPNYYHGHATRIDLKEGKETAASVGGNPGAVWAGAMDMAPNGTRAVVSVGRDGRNYDMDNDQLSVMNVDGDQFELAGEIKLPDEPRGHGVAFSADSSNVYAVTYPRKSPSARLYEATLVRPYKVARWLEVPGGDLGGVASCDDARKIYVSDRAAKKILVIDPATLTVSGSIDLEGCAPETLAVSPDQRVLYALTPATRLLWAVDTSTDRVLASLPGLRRDATDMAFSPDGTRVYVTHRGPDGGICVVRIVPGTLTAQPSPGSNVTGSDSLAGFAAPGAAKANVCIVFSSDRGGNHQLYKMTKDGTIARLTRNNASEGAPRWSPDGSRIAFITDREGPFRVAVMNSDGTGTRVLKGTDSHMEFSDTVPLAWSPNGRQLVFVSVDRASLRVVNADGTDVRTLVKGSISHGYSSYAGVDWPEPDRIVFSVSNPSWGYYTDVFSVNVTNGVLTQLTDNWGGSTPISAPAVSPDGTRMVVVVQEGHDPPPRSVHLLLADGTGMTNIRQWAQIDASPSWTPDGKRIVFSSGTMSKHHIWIMNADGSTPVQLTQGDSNDLHPSAHGL